MREILTAKNGEPTETVAKALTSKKLVEQENKIIIIIKGLKFTTLKRQKPKSKIKQIIQRPKFLTN